MNLHSLHNLADFSISLDHSDGKAQTTGKPNKRNRIWAQTITKLLRPKPQLKETKAKAHEDF